MGCCITSRLPTAITIIKCPPTRPEACDLALMAFRMHELIEWDYQPEAAQNPGHRPVTLLLANGDSLDAMRSTVCTPHHRLVEKHAHGSRPIYAITAASLQIESIDTTGYQPGDIRNTSTHYSNSANVPART